MSKKKIENLVKKIKEAYSDVRDSWDDDQEKERKKLAKKKEKLDLKEAQRILKICLRCAKLGSSFEWFVINDDVAKILRRAGLVVTNETTTEGDSKKISWPVG